MANLLAQFEPSELVDFMNFIGLLIHKLQVRTMLQAVDLSLTSCQQAGAFQCSGRAYWSFKRSHNPTSQPARSRHRRQRHPNQTCLPHVVDEHYVIRSS